MDIQLSYLRYIFKTLKEKDFWRIPNWRKDTFVLFAGAQPILKIAIDFLNILPATLPWPLNLFSHMQKSTPDLLGLHAAPTQLGIPSPLLISGSKPICDIGLQLQGPLPIDGPNFTLFVDLGWLEVVIPEHNLESGGSKLYIPSTDIDPTKEDDSCPIASSSSQDYRRLCHTQRDWR